MPLLNTRQVGKERHVYVCQTLFFGLFGYTHADLFEREPNCFQKVWCTNFIMPRV